MQCYTFKINLKTTSQVVETIEQRHFAEKKDFAIIICILLAALSFYMLMGKNSNRPAAVISINGTVAATYPLEEDCIFEIEELPGVVFEIKNHSAAFVHSNCPDKVCVNTGFLTSSDQKAVCLPNKAVLTIIDGDDIVNNL